MHLFECRTKLQHFIALKHINFHMHPLIIKTRAPIILTCPCNLHPLLDSKTGVYRGINVFSSPEPKAHGELIVYQSSRRPSVRPSVCASVRASTLSNMNISATSKPIATKFYLKHHWAGGKAASGFWLDRIGTLVSMASDSSHWVIMEKILLAL